MIDVLSNAGTIAKQLQTDKSEDKYNRPKPEIMLKLKRNYSSYYTTE